jgi:predicted MFS family arabinose efflux permease
MLTSWVSWRWGLFINVPIGVALVVLAPRHLPETEPRPGHFDLVGALTSTLGMTTVVYGLVRAASDGWGDPLTVASFSAGAALLAGFVLTERRAAQPITPLRLFASRERSGALVARVLVVSGMFSLFFFLTQFLQGVHGYSALRAGLAFLPLTLALFAMVRVMPLLARRFDNTRILLGGLLLALAGMAWMSQLSEGTAYFPQIVGPMLLLGVGMGIALTPLTSAGIAGVHPEDAGAASGLVNVAHQLGGSLGLGILVTVFASASHGAASHSPAGASGVRYELAQGVGTALTGSALFLALALAVVFFVMRPAVVRAPAARLAEGAA